MKFSFAVKGRSLWCNKRGIKSYVQGDVIQMVAGPTNRAEAGRQGDGTRARACEKVGYQNQIVLPVSEATAKARAATA